MNNPSEKCCCIDCKTRTPTCHGICPLYKKWKQEMTAYNIKVKQIQKQQGFGLDWNNPKGYIYKRR